MGGVVIAISKTMRAALRALSYPELDIRKAYPFERAVRNLTSGKPSKLFYKPWDHVVRSNGHDIPVRIFSPTTEGEHAILLFFHGGGWVTGNIDSYDRICNTMAKLTDRSVISVDYRLAPEYKFPAAPEDCYAVARDIFTDYSLFGIHAREITLIGDSAGANLAAAVSLMARDRGEFMPSSQILLYPATAADHSEQSIFPSVRENGTDYLLTSKRICDYMELYQSSADDLKNPYFAPLEAHDFSGQPKTLIITAQYDPLRDEGEAYGEALSLAGNTVMMHRISDGLHGFISLPSKFPAVKEAYYYINRFLNEVSRP